jgi:hypothetical protein
VYNLYIFAAVKGALVQVLPPQVDAQRDCLSSSHLADDSQSSVEGRALRVGRVAKSLENADAAPQLQLLLRRQGDGSGRHVL